MCECEEKLAEAMKRLEVVESVQLEQSKTVNGLREILRFITGQFLGISEKTSRILKQEHMLVKKD